MTFYEAAVEVLRRTGRPLHFKKITEIAVREDLLSHVGRDPNDTMSKRLEKEVQKSDQTAIDQKRPGVFQLLDEDRAKEIIERVEQKQKQRRERKRTRQKNDQNESNRSEASEDHESSDDAADSQGGGGNRRQARGSKTNKAQKTRKKKKSDDSSGNQKRKRKRTRGDDDSEDQKRRRRRSRSESDSDDDQPQTDAPATNEPAEAGTRDGGRKTSPAPSVSSAQQIHLEQGPVRLEGIPKAAYKVLEANGGGPVPIDELAERIFEQKMVKFHTHEPVTTVKSALANDNQIRADRGHRPLFDHDGTDNWWLTKGALSASVYEREQKVLSLTEEIRQESMEQLGERLRDIAPEALEYLALTLLERLGYSNIKVSKRSSEGDVFFTADRRQGLADVRVCVRVVTDTGRTLERDAVDDLRETLGHYSASEGVAIHLGEIDDQAVDGARLESQAPITIFDRETFVELLVKHGIGIETYRSPIVTVDSDFIDALGD